MIKDKALNEIGKLNQRINSLEKLIKITDLATDDFKTKVMLMYLEHEGVSKVYTLLNDEGYRTPSPRGERKYTSNDVTALIEANLDNKKIDGNLRCLVKGMMTRKHKHISWMDLMLKIVNEIELN